MNSLLRTLYAITILAAIALSVGCAGGGSSENTDPANLQATLCPGQISYQNGGVEKIIFASVNGGGVSTGWVENQTGTKIGNNLAYVQGVNSYETVLSEKSLAIPEGNYSLKYFVGSEELTFKRDQMSWTTLPGFNSPFAPTWDPTFKRLSVQIPTVSRGQAKFYVRLYFANAPDVLYDQSSTQDAGIITMGINQANDYTIVLFADFIENGQIVSVARHVFQSMSLR